MPGKIIRGSHNRLALLVRYRNGDHVLLDYLTEAHAGIEALGHHGVATRDDGRVLGFDDPWSNQLQVTVRPQTA